MDQRIRPQGTASKVTETGKKQGEISKITKMHYVKLVVRSLFLIATAIVYIIGLVNGKPIFNSFFEINVVLAVVFAVYAVEMIARFFPSKLESMGCGKVFKSNYIPAKEQKPKLLPLKRLFAVVGAWVALNGAIGTLYLTGIIDAGALALVSLAYGVCDMICILFFCPFQTWFMKNRCCTDCRIYNWDFIMMCTPLAFIPNVFTITLFAISLGLFIRWEITVLARPKYFAINTNAALNCANCEEKLCNCKKQLRGYKLRHQKKLEATFENESKKK